MAPGVVILSLCLHDVIMPDVLVRDLPEDVRAALVTRARLSRSSLQCYLCRELTRLALTSSLEEITARIESRSGGEVGFRQAVEYLSRTRAECPPAA